MEKHRTQNEERLQQFRRYRDEFNKISQTLKNNYTVFEAQLKKNDVVNKKQLESMRLEELFDVPPDAIVPEWFAPFKNAQISKLSKVSRQ